MAVEGIYTQVPRETPVRPTLEHPELVEQLRHGNIYDVLRTPGINRRDIEDYLAGQHRLFQNQIRQDYEVYASQASLPPPDFKVDFADHNLSMGMSAGDRDFFRQETARLQNLEAVVNVVDVDHRDRSSRVQLRGPRGMGLGQGRGTQTPGEDVMNIADEALNDWEEFFTDLQWKAIDGQVMQQMQAKGEELNREIERIISLVMSGQADPEYVLIAAAKSNMAQNGVLFSWKGKRIMHLNEQMNKFSKELFQMDPNDQGYVRELEMSQSRTREASTQMQMELMDIQKYAQNITTTIEFASNAVRTFAQMRQTPTQAIAARGG
ncbi:MAG: hypothetical protein HY609_02170 [Deltaproteobacteria bacterium]|nr:hypothetical protein [Deltaproteobacteria bacterium]MBI4223714.1 hypothetical protein [Deltaproteobacteria bacterium]